MNDDAIKALVAKVARESADEAIASFSKRLGIDDDLSSWYADRVWLRGRRDLESAVVKHGIMAIITMSLGAMATAIVFYFRSGMPK